MQKFTRNLSLMPQPCVRVAAIVVSEINERLSPKKAPLATMATTWACESPRFPASPRAIETRATIVPTLVPMERDMKHEARKSPGRRKDGGRTLRMTSTVASTAPTLLAPPANAPARMKIHIISRIFVSAAPRENCRTLSSSFNPRVMARA